MFHQQLILLIIGIHFCLIQCSTGSPKCPRNEKFVDCKRANVATCKDKQGSVDSKCSSVGRCVCARDWLVRNDRGLCVPVWNCPDICPSHAVFGGCKLNRRPPNGAMTANDYLQLCNPKCIPRFFITMKG